MYPKRRRNENDRASRPKKRNFHGNRFTNAQSDEQNGSASARKLCTVDKTDIEFSPLHGYRIVEFLTVFGALQDILVCRQCKGNIEFRESGIRGLGFKLVVKCVCGNREINSGPLIHTGYEINRRIVFTMRLLGISLQGMLFYSKNLHLWYSGKNCEKCMNFGLSGLNTFCGLMDIGKGLTQSTYDLIVNHIFDAVTNVFKSTCKKAVQEEMDSNEKHGEIRTNLKVLIILTFCV